MKELRVKVNNIELQIREYEHEGDAIIFLHFSGANLMMWQRAISDFRDRYRLILVDLRGHGKSDKPETGYHMDEMARDVIGIMDHLALERAHVVGSSLGAEVGLSMAANYPDKVISLVCDGALNSEYGPYGTSPGLDPAHITGPALACMAIVVGLWGLNWPAAVLGVGLSLRWRGSTMVTIAAPMITLLIAIGLPVLVLLTNGMGMVVAATLLTPYILGAVTMALARHWAGA